MTTALDVAVPHWDRRERHDRWIQAEPAVVWAALNSLRAQDLPLTRLLFWLRSAGRGEPDPQVPLVDAMPLQRLAVHEPHELVLGTVSRFWSGSTPLTQPADLTAFAASTDPRWARAAMNFTLASERGGTRLATETRVVSSGERMRRAVGLYWLLVRAGSGLVRRDLLRGVDRAARRAGPPGG